MKANQQLLAQLVQEKPAQSSEREVFIRYVSDSLRAAPAEQYKQLKTRFTALLDAVSQETAPAHQPARPAQAMSAPPACQQSPQSQQYQQQAPQYQLFQQYQQQAPQYQQFQLSQGDQQPQQSQSYTFSASAGQASGEQRLLASTFTILLSTSQDLLDGSINLTDFSFDSPLLSGPSSKRPSTQLLNTPPAPRHEKKDQAEKDSDSD